MLRDLDQTGRVTWATHVRGLLFQFGFGYAWLANEIGDISSFCVMFKQRVRDCAMQHLQESVNTSSKTIHYRQFKSPLDVETYLCIDLPYMYKKALSNFRCSGHQLKIETGRHLKIDREFRFCEFCLKSNVYSVEDEFHMLLVCLLYSNLRQELFLQQWLNKIICLQTFYIIMSDKNNSNIFSLSKFIYKSFILRQSGVVQTNTS